MARQTALYKKMAGANASEVSGKSNRLELDGRFLIEVGKTTRFVGQQKNSDLIKVSYTINDAEDGEEHVGTYDYIFDLDLSFGRDDYVDVKRLKMFILAIHGLKADCQYLDILDGEDPSDDELELMDCSLKQWRKLGDQEREEALAEMFENMIDEDEECFAGSQCVMQSDERESQEERIYYRSRFFPEDEWNPKKKKRRKKSREEDAADEDEDEDEPRRGRGRGRGRR